MNSLGYLVVLQPRRLPPTHKNGQMPYGARETLFSPGFCLDRFTHWLMTRCPRTFRALYPGAGRGKLDIWKYQSFFLPSVFAQIWFSISKPGKCTAGCESASRALQFWNDMHGLQWDWHTAHCWHTAWHTAWHTVAHCITHCGTLHDSEAVLRVLLPTILRWSLRILDRQRRQI